VRFRKLLFGLIAAMLFGNVAIAQTRDSIGLSADTGVVSTGSDAVSMMVNGLSASTRLNEVLQKHPFINSKASPIFLPEFRKQVIDREPVFYLLLSLFLLLGILRVGFPGYFQNMIRVFFNTSLRQSQLTDQMMQARLPSLLFNCMFLISLALFVHVHLVAGGVADYGNWTLFFSLLLLGLVVYVGKFLVLRLMAWATGIRQALESYLFLAFLINKFMVMFLLPSVLLIVFTAPPMQQHAKDISLYGVGLFFLYRYLRTYHIIRPTIRLSRLHFLLFVFCLEIMPVLIIGRLGMLIVGKTL
jgi:hypothetical protein